MAANPTPKARRITRRSVLKSTGALAGGLVVAAGCKYRSQFFLLSGQVSTVQVDFNLPERFNISYIEEDGQRHQPIMLHRALMGSLPSSASMIAR